MLFGLDHLEVVLVGLPGGLRVVVAERLQVGLAPHLSGSGVYGTSANIVISPSASSVRRMLLPAASSRRRA